MKQHRVYEWRERARRALALSEPAGKRGIDMAMLFLVIGCSLLAGLVGGIIGAAFAVFVIFDGR